MMRKVASRAIGSVGPLQFRDADVFIEIRDRRWDEDPRHQWCPEFAEGHHPSHPMSCGHWVWHCHRCDTTYIELLHDWREMQTPGWDQGSQEWESVDPKRRSFEQARRDFENSVCDGERRVNREGWALIDA